MSTTKSEKRVNFLEKLAPELRNHIFTLAVVPDDYIWITTPDRAETLDVTKQSPSVQNALNTMKALSRVNKQMASESRAVFFSETTFIISSGVRKEDMPLRFVGRVEGEYEEYAKIGASPRTLPRKLIDNMSNIIIEARGPRPLSVSRPSDAFIFDMEFRNARPTPWFPGSEGGYILSIQRKAGGNKVDWIEGKKKETTESKPKPATWTITNAQHTAIWMQNLVHGVAQGLDALYEEKQKKKQQLMQDFEDKAPGIVAHIMSKRRWSVITLAEVLRVLGQDRML